MFWYQINPDYFSQVLKHKNIIEDIDSYTFFNLVSAALPYIKSLGADGIWLMPLYIRGEKNKKGKGSPYAVKEYEIDPKFGTKQDLINLVQLSHDYGFKIITEYVPNHLAPDASFVIDHPEAVYRDKDGNLLYDQNWNDTVKLSHKDPIVQKFTRDNLVRLLETYHFDGFRLDMAHCPFYDIDGHPLFGEYDEHFWGKVFSDSILDNKKLIWLAEVYDDRNHEKEGYGDHILLMRNNMYVYDKRIHDQVGNCLEGIKRDVTFQAQIIRENEYQFDASKSALSRFYAPYLRLPSNHDDCPGIWNFGGVSEYALAFSILTLMPGDSMVYAGDEYGLEIMPSRSGEVKVNEQGFIYESDILAWVKEDDQKHIFDRITSILQIKSEYKHILDGAIRFINNRDREGNEVDDMLTYVRFSTEEKKCIVVTANLSHTEKKWSKLNEVIDVSFGYEKGGYWYEFLESLNPHYLSTGFKLTNLLTDESYGCRNLKEEFWVGLEPMEVQVLLIENNTL